MMPMMATTMSSSDECETLGVANLHCSVGQKKLTELNAAVFVRSGCARLLSKRVASRALRHQSMYLMDLT